MGFPGLDKLMAETTAALAEAETRNLFYGFEFRTTKTKWAAFDAWKVQHNLPLSKRATTGEQYTYEITPTGLGTIVVVRDMVTKDEFKLNDWALFG